MKRLYLLLLVLAAIVGLTLLGLAIAQHQGYVLLAYKGFRFESSLWAFVGLLLVLWMLLYGLRLLLRFALTSAGLVNPWSGLHERRRTRMAARPGVLGPPPEGARRPPPAPPGARPPRGGGGGAPPPPGGPPPPPRRAGGKKPQLG